MSKNIYEQIRYLESRRKYREILRNKKNIQEVSDPYYADSGLFAAIGNAMGDIFKSLKLTAMDISNELRFLGEKFLYRNNPAKLKEAGDNYNRKRDKILKEWEPIVKNSMDALNNADPFLTVALAPQVFLATKGVQAGIKAGKTATEIIVAEDWESMRAKINKFQTGTEENPQAGVEMGIGAIHDQMAQQNNLLMQLNNLFMGRGPSDVQAAKVAGGDLSETDLYEQDEQEKKKEPPGDDKITNPEEWLSSFFEMTGIDEQFTDAAAEALEQKTELMSEMIDSITSSTAIMKLVGTRDLAAFKKTVADIVKSADMPPESVKGFGDMLPQIEQQAKKIAATDDFKKQVADAKQVAVESLSDEDFLDTAIQAVFKTSKAKFDENYTSDLKKFISVIEENHKLLALDNETMNLIRQRSSDLFSSEEFLKVYDTYMDAYKEFADLQKRARL